MEEKFGHPAIPKALRTSKACPSKAGNPASNTVRCEHWLNRVASSTDRRFSASAMLLLVLVTGCSSRPYHFGSAQQYRTSEELLTRTTPQIERGKPHRVLDGIGWVWGIPGKVLLFDRRVENHDIDQQTEAAMAAYLAQNELHSVKVRLNQYHPGDDWKRLAANKSVGAGWRYTLGTFSVLTETLFPGRIFGGDHYNPFTNTVHLYSNVPALAWHEAGHAKDFARRKWKGTYAAAYLLPSAALYHEAIATSDAIGYAATTGSVAAQKEAYQILYPAYGTYVGNAVSGYIPLGYVAGVVAGHIAGRHKAGSLQEPMEEPRSVVHSHSSSRPGKSSLPPFTASTIQPASASTAGTD